MQDQDKETKACVLGYPVEHSLSPLLHGHWLTHYGLQGRYTQRETKPEDLASTLKQLIDEGYAGCNLTVPLKEKGFALADEVNTCAQSVGAANTLVFKDNKIIAYNSDGFGFIEGLTAQRPEWQKNKAVVLGAGGAARAVIHTLQEKGVNEIMVVNRTAARAEKLIQDLALPNTSYLAWEKSAEALADASLLINCTTLGMEGQPPLDIDLSTLPKTAVVADIVYKPLFTPLLEHAKNQGNPVAEGLPMLLHQGRLGFKYWFGIDPKVDPILESTIREAVQ